MKRALVLGALVIVGALSAALGAAARVGQGAGQQPSAGALQVDKLKDNLYVLRGGGGNTAAFITANGVVLVDTKLPGWGKPLLEKVKELTDKPVTTIINTHTHFDHVSGNVDFPATVEVVTHENTAKLMREMRPPTGFPNAPPNMFEDSKGVGLPKRTFKDQMTLGSGNDRIELHYFGPAHTSGDTFVVFPTLRAMHTGDVFPNKGIPIMDANNGGSGIEYANTLAKAAALQDIDIVITGHNTTTLTMADLKMYTDFNREFIEAVKAAKTAGRTIDDLASTLESTDPVPGSRLQPAAARYQWSKCLAPAHERGSHLERAEVAGRPTQRPLRATQAARHRQCGVPRRKIRGLPPGRARARRCSGISHTSLSHLRAIGDSAVKRTRRRRIPTRRSRSSRDSASEGSRA